MEAEKVKCLIIGSGPAGYTAGGPRPAGPPGPGS